MKRKKSELILITADIFLSNIKMLISRSIIFLGFFIFALFSDFGLKIDLIRDFVLVARTNIDVAFAHLMVTAVCISLVSIVLQSTMTKSSIYVVTILERSRWSYSFEIITFYTSLSVATFILSGLMMSLHNGTVLIIFIISMIWSYSREQQRD